ncbi:MAG: caspase family protein [Gemmatimonadaceae bacterium]|nr:caspase family protein [Gemmatimonadaceae bacterium]
MPTEPSGSVRRALLVGINAYSNRPLGGCIADAELVATVLQERFAFERANVTLLRDREASREGLLAALDTLIDATRDGDTAFVYYAGHGALAPSPDLSEASGSESTFCVCEDPREDIYDDEFGARLTALARRTRHTVVVADCCHSGTIARDAGRGTARSTTPVPPGPRAAKDYGRHAATDESARAAARYVLIAGSRDDEESKEVDVAGDGSITHGALTWALTRELMACAPGTTWRDVFQRVAAAVTGNNPAQHPQLEGDADLEIFGVRTSPGLPSVPVLERSTRQVLLGGGAIHGLTVGSQHRIFPQGTRAGDAVEPLGTVEVTRVTGITARARITGEAADGAIVAGTRAAPMSATTVAQVLALTNTAPESRMAGGVTLELLRSDDGRTFTPARADSRRGMPVLETGDNFTLRITSTLQDAVFVNLFAFNPEGGIDALTPGAANQLAAGGTWDLSEALGGGFDVTWTGDDAVQSFKLFASKEQVDLSGLTRLDHPTRGEAFTGHVSATDWTTVTLTTTLRRRIALDGRGAADVAGATVTARGMTGTIRGLGSAPDVAAITAPDSPLARALATHGAITQQSLVLTDAAATPAARDGTATPPQLTVQVPDPGEGYAQVAMVTDASGLVSWHFAPDRDAAPATRDGSVPTLRTRTFTFDATPSSAPGDSPASRGVLLALGQKLINIYAFPLGKAVVAYAASTVGERIELDRTPYRVRTFQPTDYATGEAREFATADWEALGRGRALLMIHGTNSRTHTAFGGLPREFVEAMHVKYEGRVFAFDHPTLTHSPRQNVETLLSLIPDGLQLDVDIICHSRGGLVSRVLAERQDALDLGTRGIRVGAIVFVGSPNAGTAMADEACIGDFLDTCTNLLNLVPTNGVTDALGLVLTGVKLVATGLWSGLAGLRAMQPSGDFGTWLAEGTQGHDTKYYALASDFSSARGGALGVLAEKLAGRVFKGARNDLVVPTDGVYAANGSRFFPIDGQVVFSDEDGVPHTGFFQFPRTTAQITTWLA